MERLKAEITCSICLETLDNPVIIDCGHNFCHGCLSEHWSRVSPQHYRCPECRRPYNKDRMIPDIRLRNLVEKIRQLQLEKEAMAAQPGPGHPVQLMETNREGDLVLNEGALSRILESEEVKNAHVCLIAILGEQRRGKSFLLNYLLRRFQSMEAGDESWMGQEDEPLIGFPWRAGVQATSLGVWMWSQPFWVQTAEGKVAVFLVDIEGCMGIGRNNIKLSAFSLLLSSFQIVNIPSRINEPLLDYLERFAFIATEVGEACGLMPIQHLDLLVRDWYQAKFGVQRGEAYLRTEIQKLEESKTHQQSLAILKRTDTRCFVLPHPGLTITLEGYQGSLRDMSPPFRQGLKMYISEVVAVVGRHVKRSQNGQGITGGELATKIKKVSSLMKRCRYGFKSLEQLRITFHNENVSERIQHEYKLFQVEQEGESQDRISWLNLAPEKMEERFAEKQEELLSQCWEELQGSEQEKEEVLEELEKEMNRGTESFLESYKKRYKNFQNENVSDHIRHKYKHFQKEQEAESQPMISGLKLTPKKMGKRFAEKQEELLSQCWNELQGSEQEMKEVLGEIEKEMYRGDKSFLESYKKCYKKKAVKTGICVGAGVAAVGTVLAAAVAFPVVALAGAAALGVEEAIAVGAGVSAVAGIGTGAALGSTLSKRADEDSTQPSDKRPLL